jgi:diphthamide synthase (EF-2-diphthine--ammonia ligase)
VRGEGGEYESLTLNSPLFKVRLPATKFLRLSASNVIAQGM